MRALDFEHIQPFLARNKIFFVVGCHRFHFCLCLHSKYHVLNKIGLSKYQEQKYFSQKCASTKNIFGTVATYK